MKEKTTLHANGYLRCHHNVDEIKKSVSVSDWGKVDNFFQSQTSKDGALFKLLSEYCTFENIEFIISLRESLNEWEEDGIWHDDGSRILAFSLSLTEKPNQCEGGVLELRRKGETNSTKITPFPFGEIIIFQTGVNGWEHKINAVTKGKRLIIAGWCS